MIHRKRPATTMEQVARRALGGLKAKRVGDAFENLFARACQKERVIFEKIPTGCRVVGRGVRGTVTAILERTPYDYFIAKDGKAAGLDCKTVQAGNFCFSDVKAHQLESLLKISVAIPAGYVVLFRDVNVVSFFHATALQSLKRRGSLSPMDGTHLGRDTDFSVLPILNYGASVAANEVKGEA